MEVEQIEIANHLRRFEPFDALPEEAVARVAANADVAYYKAGSDILLLNDEIHDLYFIRSGAVELFRRDGEFFNRLGEGELLGQTGLMMRNRVRFPARALEDTLLYIIPETIFDELCDQHDVFADFVEFGDHSRLQQAISRAQQSNEMMRTKVSRLIGREPVSVDQTASVHQTAIKMTEERVSSVLVTDMNEDGESTVVGIVTDQDLRTRFISPALEFDTPITAIMSANPVTLDANLYVFDAMLTMLRHNVHHLPLMRSQQAVGVIALSDLIRYESQNSLFVVAKLLRAQNQEELVNLGKDIDASFVRMVNEDANSHMVGSAMTVFGRSIFQRLLELAEEQLGPPPIPCCFLTLGSMARDELLPGGDQDNALVLDDSFDAAKHDGYFQKLAAFVSDGLAANGFAYCKGGVMATTDKWRQPRHVWKKYFADWIAYPSKEAMLNSSMFFDLDGVWGHTEWVIPFRQQIARQAANHNLFLSSLGRAALYRTPPLGFFKDFVLEQDGEHKNSLNLKRRGTAPLAALVRVHALAVGSTAQNTFERLEDIKDARHLPPGRAEALRDAMEIMSVVRQRHHADQISRKQKVDNNINPEDLSQFDRRNLKEAFQVLNDAQNYLKVRPAKGRYRGTKRVFSTS
ncbi:putative nucleotidyltransferase substrate binding domain-containing protein [Desulfonatronum thiodismutans]|uniref:putative nucleotidyltransferase substrate binding domain-containing protein n=1 Tax=Desulfonatronum thiodismutans TaxID=159290 RepID=UPI0004ABED89|nr:putative nucleotidyltransferase substrate binding domain-containing protein [Desulfonatronum thiodismutans]